MEWEIKFYANEHNQRNGNVNHKMTISGTKDAAFNAAKNYQRSGGIYSFFEISEKK